MPDREIIINAIKCRAKRNKRCGNPCEETGFCHYATAIRGLDGEIYKPYVCDVERLCNDTIALLKEDDIFIKRMAKLNDDLNAIVARIEKIEGR